MRWGVLILLGVFFVSFASAAIPDDCMSSMVAYWQFESNVLDSVGPYDGSYSGGWDDSVVDKGLFLTGSNIVTVGGINDKVFRTPFSVEMWVNKKLASANVDATLVELGQYKIMHTSDDKISVSVGGVTVNSSPISDGVNYHVAVIWQSAGNNPSLRIYIDGVENGSVALTGAASTGSSDMIIGSGFVGFIDELAFYSSTLSVSVIRQHRDLGKDNKDYCDPTGAGGSSLTEAAFNIQGCNFYPTEGVIVGVSKGKCSSEGIWAGKFYCSDDKEAFNTTAPFNNPGWVGNLGCAMGDGTYDPLSGDPFCCPVRDFCNNTGIDTFRCDQRPDNCFEKDGTDEGECQAMAGCTWWDCSSKCIGTTNDLTCADYCNNDIDAGVPDRFNCEADFYGLSDNELGVDACERMISCNDTTFSVFCSCSWHPDDDEGKKCKNAKLARETFYGATQNVFKCVNTNTLGECIDGEQAVSWYSNISVLPGGEVGFNASDYSECLEKMGCNGGEGRRFCGEPVVKLPGFSFFALFASLFLIGLYYVNKYEKV